MTFFELLTLRYSCRRYLDLPVKQADVVACLEAARVAPSACNAQPWKFIAVDDIALKQRLAEAATPGVYSMSKMLFSAPVVVAVLADKGSFLSRAGSFARNTRFYLLDVGIACEHLVLQATELGLASCYVGWFNEPAVKKVLGVPKALEVPLLITLGHPEPAHKAVNAVRRRAGGATRRELKDVASFNKVV